MEEGRNSINAENDVPEVIEESRPGGRREFLQALSLTAAASAAACGKDSPSQPSPATTSRATTTSTSSTTTTSTTTSIGPTFTLTGQVTGNSRNIGGALVEVTSPGPNLNKSTTTDLTGRYELNGLVAGTFTVRVSAGGYATQSSTVTLTGNQSLQVQMVQISTTTSQPPVTSSTVGSGGGGTSHYWYPN